jgi:hypothetical protein
MGVMCSKPGGGTSQYREGLRLLVFGLRSLGDLDLNMILISERKQQKIRKMEKSIKHDGSFKNEDVSKIPHSG